MRISTLLTILIVGIGLLFITGKAQSLSEKNTKTALITAKSALAKKLRYGMNRQDVQLVLRQEGFQLTKDCPNSEEYRFASSFVGFGASMPGDVKAACKFKEGLLMSYKLGFVNR